MKDIFSYISTKTYELSGWDCFNDGSQNMLHGVDWLIIPKLFQIPLLIWSTGIDAPYLS